MKILVISDYGAPAGGAEQYTFNLISGLKAAGHSVRLFSGDLTVRGMSCLADYTFPGYDQASRWLKLTRGIYNAMAVRALRHAIDDFRPDVIHLQMFLQQCSPSILGELRGIPTFVTIHEYRLFCPIGTKFIMDTEQICVNEPGCDCVANKCVNWAGLAAYSLQRSQVKKYLGKINQWLPPSSYAEARLRAFGVSNIARLPYGFDPARLPFMPPSVREPTKQVLYLGRLDVAKGVKILVKTFVEVIKQVPEAKLLIVGQGSVRSWIENEISKKGLENNITLHDWVPADKIAELHHGSAVLAAPSIWPDNLPLVICEAMFLGTPVLATNVGGVPDIVENGVTGRLVRPHDHGEMAMACIEMLKNVKNTNDISINARKIVGGMLDMGQHIERLSDIYAAIGQSVLIIKEK